MTRISTVRWGRRAVLLLLLLGVEVSAPLASNTTRADIYDLSLRPTRRGRGAAGVGRLIPPSSPFGIAVSREGHLAFDLELRVTGLRPAASIGPYATYSVWMTTPELDRTRKLGNLPAAGVLRARVDDFNKFILMVTAEASETHETRAGPILLRGISPSGLLTSFGQHELFSTMPHD